MSPTANLAMGAPNVSPHCEPPPSRRSWVLLIVTLGLSGVATGLLYGSLYGFLGNLPPVCVPHHLEALSLRSAPPGKLRLLKRVRSHAFYQN